METIAIINQKGGVAKSTTAAALLAGLSLKGKRTLAIDLDAQCNLSLITNASTKGLTIADVLASSCSISEAIQPTAQGDVIAGAAELARIEAILKGKNRHTLLRDVLKPLKYDYIVLDTPPALSLITLNALIASNKIIIPTQADLLSLQGIKSLGETIEAVRLKANAALKIEGILLTRYNPRNIYTQELTELLQEQAGRLGTKVFKHTIREAIAIKESQIQQQSIFEYAPKAKVTGDYKGFVSELIGD